MMCNVSIIVPIYNAENTLRRCLESLRNQTLRDFEVIMIDDGSSDSCGTLIDDYAVIDGRFKSFHKKNGGVASARQFGIEHAQGEYTIHCDPDDWVEPVMLEKLYNKAKETGADIVICDYFVNDYKGQTYVVQKPSSLNHETVLKELFAGLIGSVWNKLIKRSCYTENNDVSFPLELSFCEDLYVCASILLKDVKIGYVHDGLYHYVRNSEDSLSRTYSSKIYEKDILLRTKFDMLFENSNLRYYIYEKISYTIVSRAFYFGGNYFNSISFKEQFYSYKNFVLKNADTAVEKYFLYFSCLGFYKPLNKLLKKVLILKRMICELYKDMEK